MGKSKRIRSDRARLMVESPDKYAKDESARKSRITTIVLICIMAVIILATSTLVVLDKTGSFDRAVIVYRSDNFKINATMASYMYYYTYNSAYAQYGQYAGYFVSQDSITTSAKELLVLCEAANAEGIKLGDFENRKIDEAIKSIKEDVKEAGISISQLYGNCGVNAKDIRDVLELQYLANMYQAKQEQGITDTMLADPSTIDTYFEENKSTLFKGDYLSVNTQNAAWREKLSAAKDAEEFKKIFTELYITDNFLGSFNSAANIPAEAIVEKLISATVAELKYSLLSQAAPDGVTFAENSTREDRIKAIYAKDSATVGAKDTGLTYVSSKIYTDLAAKVDTISAEISQTLNDQTDKDAFIETKVTESLEAFYKVGTLPSMTLLESLRKAVIDAVAFMLYDIEVEGVELTKGDAITSSIIKNIYEAKYLSAYTANAEETGIKTVTDALYTTVASGADSIKSSVESALTVKAGYTYPNKTTVSADSYPDATTTTAGETTTAGDATTTTAGDATTTTAGDTTTTTAAQTTTTAATTVDSTPADPELLNSYDTWFFSGDRKENDVFTENEKTIYFVTKPAVKNTELSKNVAHILISANTITPADATNAQQVADAEAETQNEFDAAKEEAESILAKYLAGELTKEAFIALGNQYTDDSNVTYNNVRRDTMVEAFNDWIFDEARQAGDTGIVKTDYGYHIIYFVGNGIETWKSETVEAAVGEKITDLKTELASKYAVSVIDKGLEKVFG